MHLCAYTPALHRKLLDLTLAVFEPFYEESFRPLMGETIFAVQHREWQAEYARLLAGLHEPARHRFIDLALADDGDIAGYVAWHLGPSPRHGEITLLAVRRQDRGQGTGRALCEHAMDRMKALGAEIVEISTGGDPFHAPARSLYEALGCTRIPVAVYFREL